MEYINLEAEERKTRLAQYIAKEVEYICTLEFGENFTEIQRHAMSHLVECATNFEHVMYDMRRAQKKL